MGVFLDYYSACLSGFLSTWRKLTILLLCWDRKQPCAGKVSSHRYDKGDQMKPMSGKNLGLPCAIAEKLPRVTGWPVLRALPHWWAAIFPCCSPSPTSGTDSLEKEEKLVHSRDPASLAFSISRNLSTLEAPLDSLELTFFINPDDKEHC